VELLDRPLSRIGRHPGELIEIALHCGLDLANHIERTLLAFGAESLLDVKLAESEAEIAIHRGHASLPACFLFFGAREEPAKESEVFLVKLFRQKFGLTIHQMDAEVVFPCGERLGFQQGLRTLEEIGNGDVESRLEYQGPEGHFTYPDAGTGRENITVQTDSVLGPQIHVVLIPTIDTKAVNLTVLLPPVNLADREKIDFHTIAIKTTSYGLLPREGARLTYEVIHLQGKAERRIMPLAVPQEP
jgi:hypothetical protein